MAHLQQPDDSFQTLPPRQISDPLQDAQDQAPWFSENYFTTRHPATRALRKMYIKIIAIMSALVIVFMMGALSIYWGALYVTPQQAHNLGVWIVVSLVLLCTDHELIEVSGQRWGDNRPDRHASLSEHDRA